MYEGEHTNFDASFGIPSTKGTQLEKDYEILKQRLDEAVMILEEADSYGNRIPISLRVWIVNFLEVIKNESN